MRTLVLLGIIFTLFALSLRSGRAAVYTYWWFGIFRPHDWAWESVIRDLSLTKVAAALLLLQAIIRGKLMIPTGSQSKLMAVFLLAVGAAYVTTGCADIYVVRTADLFEITILFLMVFITSNFIKTKRELFWLLVVIAGSIAFHSGKGGFQSLLTGQTDNYNAKNLTGLFSGSNAYALGSSMLIFLMILSFQYVAPFLARTRLSYPWITWSVKAIIAISILGTVYNTVTLQSRGSFLALMLGFFAWILMQRARVTYLASAFVIGLAFLAVVPLPEGYKDRITSAFADEEERDKSAASRPHYWRTAVKMANDHPLGVGPGCYPAYYDTYDETGGFFGNRRSVHSSHFQILADTGYVGAVIWIALIINGFVLLFRIRRQHQYNAVRNGDSDSQFFVDLANSLICVLLVFVVGGAFYEYAYNDIIWLVWALLGPITVLSRKQLATTDETAAGTLRPASTS